MERRPDVLLRLVGEGAAGACSVGLAHVTQFLQDAAEEAVVLLWCVGEGEHRGAADAVEGARRRCWLRPGRMN